MHVPPLCPPAPPPPPPPPWPSPFAHAFPPPLPALAGLYGAALVLLYTAAKPLLSQRAAAPPAGATWVLDVLVCRALLEALVGTHIVACLGAAWLPWLLLWEAWCGLQCLGLAGPRLGRGTQAGLVVVLALGLPGAMALLPFHPGALTAQAAAFRRLPWLAALPSVPRLLLLPYL